jgi:hypothetical protein
MRRSGSRNQPVRRAWYHRAVEGKLLGLDGYRLAVAAGRTIRSFRVTSDTAVTICREGTGAHETRPICIQQ